jgi:hypothetical protein
MNETYGSNVFHFLVCALVKSAKAKSPLARIKLFGAATVSKPKSV